MTQLNICLRTVDGYKNTDPIQTHAQQQSSEAQPRTRHNKTMCLATIETTKNTTTTQYKHVVGNSRRSQEKNDTTKRVLNIRSRYIKEHETIKTRNEQFGVRIFAMGVLSIDEQFAMGVLLMGVLSIDGRVIYCTSYNFSLHVLYLPYFIQNIPISLEFSDLRE